MTDLTNTSLGQYQLTELIRRGGMSMVYKAYQPSLDRYVAVKVLLPMEDQQFASRFKREGRAIAQLQHPNILPIYDTGEQNGMLFIVLQYVEDGLNLGDMLGKPLDPAFSLRLVRRLLDGLDYAHHRGIVHRDIKPGNILMPSPSWPMLGDFGIAKVLNESQQLTLANLMIGTPAYIAPEQAIGRPIDARTDLYSVGVVLFEMLTGQIPFDADSPFAVAAKHAYEQPPVPRELNPELPDVLDAVLLQALAKDPTQRFQSAAEMAAVLERLTPEIANHARGQIDSLYRAGVAAFQSGSWDVAVEKLQRVIAIDAGFEDATLLLDAAQQRQAPGTAHAPMHHDAAQHARTVPATPAPRRETDPRATFKLSSLTLQPTDLVPGDNTSQTPDQRPSPSAAPAHHQQPEAMPESSRHEAPSQRQPRPEPEASTSYSTALPVALALGLLLMFVLLLVWFQLG